MRSMKSLCAAVALGAAMLCGSTSQASIIQFVTTGEFTGGVGPQNTATYDNGAGVVINFNNSFNNTVSVPPASSASFGSFTVVTTNTTPTPVVAGFTLFIQETSVDMGPAPPGTLSFAAGVTGTLTIFNSQAFVQFTGPLSGSIGNVTYTIVSADSGTPGRVNLSPPGINNGTTTIAGLITAVPEPSSLALLGLGVPMLLVFRARRNRAAA